MIATTLSFLGRLAGRVVVAARRHVVVAGVSGALLAASAGGGIAYAMSQRPATATLTAATGPSSTLPAPGAKAGNHARFGRGLALRGLIALVAKDTGQTRAQVLAALRSGKSLDQIAGSKASAVEQTVLSRLQARLARAVTAKRITQAQADARYNAFKSKLEKVMATPGNQLPLGHRGPRPATSAPGSPASSS